MEWSDRIAFHPWVGREYLQGFPIAGGRIRLLLLGEAHVLNPYDNDSRNRSQGVSFTSDSISNYLADAGAPGRRWRPAAYWTRVGKVIAGPDSYDRQAFWHSAAFYNYVQSFQPLRSGPPDAAYAGCRPAFDEVLEKLRPDAVVVLCKRLWWRVNDLVGAYGVLVNHPSSPGFTYSHWHPVITKRLTELKEASRGHGAAGTAPPQ